MSCDRLHRRQSAHAGGFDRRDDGGQVPFEKLDFILWNGMGPDAAIRRPADEEDRRVILGARQAEERVAQGLGRHGLVGRIVGAGMVRRVTVGHPIAPTAPEGAELKL